MAKTDFDFGANAAKLLTEYAEAEKELADQRTRLEEQEKILDMLKAKIRSIPQLGMIFQNDDKNKPPKKAKAKGAATKTKRAEGGALRAQIEGLIEEAKGKGWTYLALGHLAEKTGKDGPAISTNTKDCKKVKGEKLPKGTKPEEVGLAKGAKIKGSSKFIKLD